MSTIAGRSPDPAPAPSPEPAAPFADPSPEREGEQQASSVTVSLWRSITVANQRSRSAHHCVAGSLFGHTLASDDGRRRSETSGSPLRFALTTPESQFSVLPRVIATLDERHTRFADSFGGSLSADSRLRTLGKGSEEQIAMTAARRVAHPLCRPDLACNVLRKLEHVKHKHPLGWSPSVHRRMHFGCPVRLAVST